MLSLPRGKKIVSLGTIAIVVVAGVVGYISYQGLSMSTTQTPARVVAEQSITRLRDPNFSQEERKPVTAFGGLEKLENVLQYAINAQDLAVLTYDEFKAQPLAKDHDIQAQDPEMNAKIRGGKFLEFTDADGSKVTIGIDEDNVPFMFQSISSGGRSVTAVGGISFGRPEVPPQKGASGASTGSATATTVP